MKGILGRKIGMTQVFDQDGKLTPVTVIEVTPNVVTQIKTKQTENSLFFLHKRKITITNAIVICILMGPQFNVFTKNRHKSMN